MLVGQGLPARDDGFRGVGEHAVMLDIIVNVVVRIRSHAAGP